MLQDYKVRDAEPLILPQYGRNVQTMVDRCVEIEDREERQRCAEAIIDTMRSFATTDRGREDFEEVLWDHLFIMSDFRLEVDFPYPVTSREAHDASVKPLKAEQRQEPPKYRHYGHSVERMVEIVRSLPEGEEREELARQTAVQMKRQYCTWNKSSVSDSKIFADLYELSKGEIYLDEHLCPLPSAGQLMGQPSGTPPSGGGNGNNNRRKGGGRSSRGSGRGESRKR